MVKKSRDISTLAGTFKALSDPTRLRIVKMLRDAGGPLCVNAIAYRLDVSQSAVSQHLRVLRQAGIVTGDRAGRRVHYTVNVESLKAHERLFRSTLNVR